MVGIALLLLQTSGRFRSAVCVSPVGLMANGRHARGANRSMWYCTLRWPRTGTLSLPLTFNWPKSHKAKTKVNGMGNCTSPLEGSHGKGREKGTTLDNEAYHIAPNF